MLMQQLLAMRATEVDEAVNPDLTGNQYPEGSSDFEDAVSTAQEHLKDALDIITAGAWNDWMEATDSNFSKSSSASKSEDLVEKLRSTIAELNALYDHIVEVSED